MDLRESSRGYTKRGVEESSDVKGDRVGEEEDWDDNDKRKYRSSKPRKQSNAEEVDEWDSSERRKGSGDRSENKKRPSGSSRVGSGGEDEYDTRKDLRSKQVKKNQEEKTEKKANIGYQEREVESNQKIRDFSGSKGHGTADETERESSRKSGSKAPVHESSQSKSRSKVNSPHDIEPEKMKERDRYAVRKESSRDKGHGSRETEKNPKRRWDDLDSIRKGEETNYDEKPDSRSGKSSDVKHVSTRDRISDVRNDLDEIKSRVVEANTDKSIKSGSGEEKRTDGEKSRSRGRSEAHDEDSKILPITREERSTVPRDDKMRTARDKPSGFSEDIESITQKPSTRSHGEKIESHRYRSDSSHGVHDIVELRERSGNNDGDRHARSRERTGREVSHAKSSWSPEMNGRRRQQSGDSESDDERSSSLKGKEWEKESSFRDDRSKGRDIGWSDKIKDREGSKENWRRRHQNSSDKDSTYMDIDFDRDNDWDSQRRNRERIDNDKPYNHPGYRKFGRNEGAKSSSSYGNLNRSSDMIEIRPNSLDYGREESGSIFAGKKVEGGPHTDHTSVTNDEQWGYPPDDRARMTDKYGRTDDLQERYPDDGSSVPDQNSGRNTIDMQAEKGRGQKGVLTSNRCGGGPSPNSGFQSPFGNNQGSGNFNRVTLQGAKGSRLGRGGRGRITGRDVQRVGIQLPMMGPPFSPLGLPPGPLQTLGPNMSPGPIGLFIPQYPGPNIWPQARGIDMSMLPIQHGLSPVPPGPAPPRFPPNVVTGPNPAMYFNQQGAVRVVPPSMPGPAFNAMGMMGRGLPNDKPLGGWSTPRISGPPGKAPSRGEQNDYSQNFVDTGMRPQNYIRELELTSTVEDYPKLRELIQKKDEIVEKAKTTPMYYKCDLREFVLSPEFFGTKFDVIHVDPPWEEYVHRAPGVADHMEYWTFEEISNLKIEAIADTPSFIFLWVGDGVGLEQGRQCLKKWGFRRCEDICWVKTNKSNATPGLRHDSHTLFQHSKVGFSY
ncbi:N6-adenosine-methyltransferase non-catalytic subunit mtb [Thalictrum thalictroides]|uniref:N6-adenosine-methyltransferase non-catalytic subunit mtb n=1 Tax=Thalictrum thalictroides TaxID=46969 RepID=A0A7J6V0F4_THATH|nr:N6-adenosine-methyltransferase non-catalytic subunit mtb [Thalictrum thalictroides]